MGLKITYIARHYQANSNDDEGAITHALELLGHHVTKLREYEGKKAFGTSADLILFHHWSDYEDIAAVKDVAPTVFWYFDLVDHQDESKQARTMQRMTWMERVTPLVNAGFCTDGDWIEHPRAALDRHKLFHLPQGFDERLHKPFVNREPTTAILFCGSRNVTEKRKSWLNDVVSKYGDRFFHIPGGIYRERLWRAINNTAVVIAPDSPGSDRYWSNRVYLVTGVGGFIIHPLSLGLSSHFQGQRDLVYYTSREEMYGLIDYYLERPKERASIARAGQECCMKEHTYRHRCETLLATLKKRGVI